MIGPHNSRHPLDQSDARVRSISFLLPTFSRASLNLVWLLEIFVFALIGLNEHFGCGFTITNRGVLEMKFNPFHPNISMHILHTVLFTFPKALTRGICLKINSFISLISPRTEHSVERLAPSTNRCFKLIENILKRGYRF